jgi:hypothetical protein
MLRLHVSINILKIKKVNRLMNVKQAKLVFLSAILSLFIIAPAFAGELVTWNNTVATNFTAHQCVTIQGTPGTPKKCAPS